MTEFKPPVGDRVFVPKGWGYEDWIVNKPEYCGKILFFKKGKRCSWHYHNEKDETFYIQSGKLKVWYAWTDERPTHVIDICDIIGGIFPGDRSGIVELEPGDTFYVPPGLRHQMLGLLDTVMFEFSTEHKEEDSIRVEKGD